MKYIIIILLFTNQLFGQTIQELEAKNVELRSSIDQLYQSIDGIYNSIAETENKILANLEKIEKLKQESIEPTPTGSIDIVKLLPIEAQRYEPNDGHYITYDLNFLVDKIYVPEADSFKTLTFFHQNGKGRLFKIFGGGAVKIEDEKLRNTVRVLFRGFKQDGKEITEVFIPQYLKPENVKSVYDYQIQLPDNIKPTRYPHVKRVYVTCTIRLNSKGMPETVFFEQHEESNIDRYIVNGNKQRLLFNDTNGQPNWAGGFTNEY